MRITQALEEDIDEHGGIPIMWKTGHSHIKAKIKEVNADLAGERSGHIFIGGDEYFGFDDAIFAGAKLVEYMSNTNKSLKEILDDFPMYITSPEIKIYCPDNLKYKVVEDLVKEFKAEYGDKVIDINGARVLMDGGWGLVRASSDLPELVLVFEAKTEEKLNEIRRIFKRKLLNKVEISVDWENDIV